MFYELLVGWRYLHRKNTAALAWQILLLALIVTAAGAGLFFRTTWQGTGALLMGMGAVGSAGAALSLLFTAFTTISIIGLAFGVATLIWVLAVTSGFHDEFRRKVLGVNAHIIVLKYGIDFSEYEDVISRAETIQGINAAAPFVFNEMMMGKGTRLSGVLVKGVDPGRVSRVLDLPHHIKQPRAVTAAEMATILPASKDAQGRPLGRLPGVIIGKSLAEKLDARVGDPVRLFSPLANLDTLGWSTAKPEWPRSRDLRVSAIFDSGFSEYDKRLVYVHLREAQAFFDHGDVVTGVEIKTADVFRSKLIARTLSDELKGGAYRTVDWSELNRNLFTALQTQKLVLQLLIGFMVVVAAFNVLAALAVLALRKMREIAILKSMGMPRGGVARIFQSAGLIVWAVGTGLGLGWGYWGALALRHYRFPLDPKVYLISELPVRLSGFDFALTAAFALIVCIVATLYPALRAARINPVQGLRFQ